jgi:broad specificity phosphatase PhoE
VPPPVYLVLHGQTEWNQQGRFQGRLDSPLTMNGVEQARCMGATLKLLLDSQDNTIVSSPLGRALATARQICRVLGKDVSCIEVDDRISEIDLGSWEGLTRAEVERRWPAGRYDWYFRSPDGETFEEVSKRLSAWLKSVEARNVSTIAITHGVASRVLRGLYAQLPREEAIALENSRDAVFELQVGLIKTIRCE